MHAKCQTFIEGALANTNRVVESIKKFPIYERKCPAIFHSRSQFKSEEGVFCSKKKKEKKNKGHPLARKKG